MASGSDSAKIMDRAVRDRHRGPETKTQNDMTHPDTRIIDLTVAQLSEVIDRAVEESLKRRQQLNTTQRRLVYGIKGIAELLGVSERQARYIKASGLINRAIRQQGRTIVTDADLALQLFGRHS